VKTWCFWQDGRTGLVEWNDSMRYSFAKVVS
jgi:hypothetical protein